LSSHIEAEVPYTLTIRNASKVTVPVRFICHGVYL
jgi:hypothetical protein